MRNAEETLYEKTVAQYLIKPKGEQRIVRYFPDTHLGSGHHRLSFIADKVGLDTKKLNPGEYLVFVNKAQTALKMFAPGNVIAHLKMPDNTKIDPRIISLVPRFFNGTRINYDGAVEELLQKQFNIKQY